MLILRTAIEGHKALWLDISSFDNVYRSFFVTKKPAFIC